MKQIICHVCKEQTEHNLSDENDYVSSGSHVKKEEVSEVERALEELKEVLGASYKLDIRAQSLVNALEAEKRPSIKYVQHLESQLAEMTEAFERLTKEKDMSKPEPKIDMKEECIEPVSIWKDLFLGELDVNNDELYLMQYDGGVRLGVVLHHDALDEYAISIIGKGIYPEIEQKAIYADKCCSLTDFVKSFEQMQKDIEELKKK